MVPLPRSPLSASCAATVTPAKAAGLPSSVAPEPAGTAWACSTRGTTGVDVDEGTAGRGGAWAGDGDGPSGAVTGTPVGRVPVALGAATARRGAWATVTVVVAAAATAVVARAGSAGDASKDGEGANSDALAGVAAVGGGVASNCGGRRKVVPRVGGWRKTGEGETRGVVGWAGEW